MTENARDALAYAAGALTPARKVGELLDAYRAAVRAEAFLEAADFVDNDDDCDCGGCDTCFPRKLAAELRRMAHEAQAATPAP